MIEPQQHHLEADAIALHLVGRRAGERERELYCRAMTSLDPSLTDAERALWASMLRSARRMAWADAGLALLRPSSALRRRLFLMLAILETSPDFADKFLPRRCPPREALPVAAAAVRGAFRALAGAILVKASGL